jgi:hypothetical protein
MACVIYDTEQSTTMAQAVTLLTRRGLSVLYISSTLNMETIFNPNRRSASIGKKAVPFKIKPFNGVGIITPLMEDITFTYGAMFHSINKLKKKKRTPNAT